MRSKWEVIRSPFSLFHEFCCWNLSAQPSRTAAAAFAYRQAECSQGPQIISYLPPLNRIAQLRNDLAQGETVARSREQGENGLLAVSHLPLDTVRHVGPRSEAHRDAAASVLDLRRPEVRHL